MRVSRQGLASRTDIFIDRHGFAHNSLPLRKVRFPRRSGSQVTRKGALLGLARKAAA